MFFFWLPRILLVIFSGKAAGRSQSARILRTDDFAKFGGEDPNLNREYGAD